MKFIDIINENRKMLSTFTGSESYSIGVLSNITVNQIKEILEYYLRNEKINAIVELGGYDNIIQDSELFNKHKLVIIFWEAINLIDGLQYKCDLISSDTINDLIEKVKVEIDYVLNNLKDVPSVIINQFTPMAFNSHILMENNLDYICHELNKHLKTKNNSNLNLINIEKIFANISVGESFDLRYYYSSKALYSVNFFKEYAKHILPIPLSLNGKSKKAMIFDCDNTLWKGILGEDGFDNIVMSSKQNGGTPFEEVQSLALLLKKKGILIGLCSKNNENDITDVFQNNLNMTIHDADVTIKMVNWNDKATNLKEIGKKLNIGLDSIVFIDDSNFEMEFVKENLPMITTLLVPSKVYNYPIEMRKILNLFYSSSVSEEDYKRADMYKEQMIRDDLKQQYLSIEDYLRALEIKIEILRNKKDQIPRISQLTQKTNQFNLTTKRYSEKEIEFFIDNVEYDVLAISVSDKFGDNGITGLAIINYIDGNAFIDTFLMSCRIIGRNIELVLFDLIIELCVEFNIKKIYGEYSKTLKNEQVSDFFDRLNFQIKEKTNQSTSYEIFSDKFNKSNIDYIKINYGK